MLAQPAAGLCAPETQTPGQLRALARDAYFYAYPLVTMDMTMRQATNVPDADTVSMRAPINQFAHARAYPKADDRDVVRFNFDTLYSLAWLDIAREPIVLSVPDTDGRYYLLEMLDMWSDVFAVVGSRTTGTKAGTFAIVPAGWSGVLPQGVEKIVAPTSSIWILGRTQTNGPADYANVHKVQDGYKLAPLSQWGKEYRPPRNVPTDSSVDNKTPPQTQVNQLDGVAMLSRLATLFSTYAPHANDYPMLFRLRALGIEPGKPFDASKLDPAANAFWSITMYDKDGFQVPNAINRFAIADGSLDIYVQAESPGKDKEANWLPAPRDGPFQPTMRIYSPRPEVVGGTWAPPGLRRIDTSLRQ
jgi:hypothetical protein